MKTILLQLLLFSSTWCLAEASHLDHQFSPEILSQDTSTVFSIDTVTAENGDLVCLQLSTENFEDIILMGMNILFDDEVLRFVNAAVITDLLPGFGDNSFSSPENNGSRDKFIISWIDSDLNGEALPSSTEIFEMCFEVIGEPGEKSALTFEDVEVANSNNEIIPVEQRDGLVCVDSDVSSGEEYLQNPLLFHPNPSQGRIEFNRPVRLITIFDLYGRKVLDVDGDRQQVFHLGALPTGSYWLRTDTATLPLIIN